MRLFAILLLLAPVAAVAQPQRLSGLVVDRIDVEAAPEEDVDRLVALSGLRVDSPYSQVEIRRAVKVLHQLGRFENVYVFAKRKGNAVELLLRLPPRPHVEEIDVVQSEVLDRDELTEALGWRPGDQLDERDLPARRLRVKTSLERRGYRQAAVGLAVERLDESGGHRLIVRIDEGPTTRLNKVVIQGRPRIPLWLLGRRVGIRSGDPINLTVVEDALATLRTEYVERGYLDVQIGHPAVRDLDRIEDGHPVADLVLQIDAGPEVKIRFKGNRVVPRRELDAAVEVLEELGTGRSAAAEARERILSRYEVRGYFRARVEAAMRTTPDGSKKEILFSIYEGKGARVANIRFPGNTAVDDDDLRDVIYRSVAQTLIDDLDRPGADPETVGAMFGDASVGRRDSPQPGNVAPDPDDVYVPRAYEAATSAIGDLYQSEGYQTVRVGSPEVTERNGGSLIDVTIRIDPGVRWTVGAISFSGNESMGGSELFALSKFPFDPMRRTLVPLNFEKVIETQRAILDAYKNRGHLYANVAYRLRQVPRRRSRGGTADETRAYVSTSSSGLDVREVCRRAQEAGEETCEVEVSFVITEGPEVRARDVIVRGLSNTREGIVQAEIAVERGEVLTERDLITTRDNLLRVGVFERVEVHPIDEEQVAGEKDVVVEVRERKHLSAELGGGASTEEGVRVFAGFGNANLWGTALRFQLNTKVNLQLPPFLLLYNDEVRGNIERFYDQFSTLERIEYALAAGLAYPRIFGLPRGFSAGLDISWVHDLDPAYDDNSQLVTLVGNFKGFKPKLLGGPRPLTLQLRATVQRSDLQCNPDVGDDILCTRDARTGGNRNEGTTFYTTVGPRVSWDLRDDPLDPRAGAFVEVGSDVALGLDEASPPFLLLEGRVSVFLPLADRIVFASTLNAEKIFPFDTSGEFIDIPANRRLYGQSRIRGYPIQALLPQDVMLDSEGEPATALSPGGLLFTSVQTELRFQLYGALWLAGFYDVGDLFADGSFSLTTQTEVGGTTVTRALAQGAGVGVRVATPIGPLAVDFALPLNKRDPGAQGWTVHFAVGTF